MVSLGKEWSLLRPLLGQVIFKPSADLFNFPVLVNHGFKRTFVSISNSGLNPLEGMFICFFNRVPSWETIGFQFRMNQWIERALQEGYQISLAALRSPSGIASAVKAHGVAESIDHTGAVVGYDRFFQLLKESPVKDPVELEATIRMWHRNLCPADPPEDDVTLITVLRSPSNPTQGA